MAANCVLGQIWNGTVAEKFHTTILHVCAKFHAFIKKDTHEHYGDPVKSACLGWY